jgi:hypothetical protein
MDIVTTDLNWSSECKSGPLADRRRLHTEQREKEQDVYDGDILDWGFRLP